MITSFGWFGYVLPIKERIGIIKQAGFDGVMLWWSETLGNADYRSAPQLARQAGLFVENVHTPYWNTNDIWLDNLDGDSITALYLSIVDDCVEFAIPTMVLHLSNSGSPLPSETGLSRVKRIVEKAERCGVNVAFENLWHLELLEYVLDNINSERACFCYDSGHHNCRARDHDLLSKYGSRLMAIHLHDNDGLEDQHRLPFDGTIDWKATMRKIAQSGYKGPIALELENRGYEDLSPEAFMLLAYERAKRLEALKSVIELECQ